jgi:hypothetical protein
MFNKLNHLITFFYVPSTKYYHSWLCKCKIFTLRTEKNPEILLD